jgi:precorrin-2 dehydrogenase/sirohydrochlorin ferrochelatase
MPYYPINLNIQDRHCLVVGGGGVGTRKVESLLECGAQVTVVSPEVSDRLAELSDSGQITLALRKFKDSDLENVFLVIGATNDESLNRRIHKSAEHRGLLCNIADRPDICNFILPSVVRRGALTISISTSGRSPAMAKRLRKELERQFGEEYNVLLQLMGAIRKKLLSQAHAPEAHKPLFESLLDAGLIALVRDNRYAEINRLLEDILGKEFTYESLMESLAPVKDSSTT